MSLSSSSTAAKPTLLVGCDHAAFELKMLLLPWLQTQGYTVVDAGCPSTDALDYPNVVAGFAQQWQALAPQTPHLQGVLLCGSGVGVAMAANRYPFLRAVLAHNETLARLSRQHNDANVLCLGARFVAPALAQQLLSTWLATAFEERHSTRVNQLGTLG